MGGKVNEVTGLCRFRFRFNEFCIGRYFYRTNNLKYDNSAVGVQIRIDLLAEKQKRHSQTNQAEHTYAHAFFALALF